VQGGCLGTENPLIWYDMIFSIWYDFEYFMFFYYLIFFCIWYDCSIWCDF
jgi:hypothetical protein